MRRRDFLKFGSSGVAGLAIGGFTRTPLFRIGNIFAQGTSQAWKFGVLGDTQWTQHSGSVSIDPSGLNPNNVPVSIINQVDQQFVAQNVKFVIQVGDLTDCGNTAAIATRALAAQTNLYPHNIGFFPVRGNHETYGGQYGDNNGYALDAIRANFPQTRGQGTTWDAFNFDSSDASPDLDGISYSFDFGPSGGSVRFIMFDTWATPSKVDNNADGYAYGYTVADQQAWLSGRLNKQTRGTEHALVIAHQPLMAEDHQDTMFSGYTNANPDWQNAFFSSLHNNGVKYFISGHDHMHQRSIIASPDGLNHVEELICASCSNKFYTPTALTSANWFGQKTRETSVSQELWTVGFYIFTVDGPLVTVDFYSDTAGNWKSDANYPLGSGRSDTLITPTFNFTKKETWGYSLNGAEFLVAEGTGYTTTQITFGSTTAKFGKSSTGKDYLSRSYTKTVDAWWAQKPSGTISDVLSLAGAMDARPVNGGNPTDVFTLSMSYDPSVSFTRDQLNQGRMISLNVLDENGSWVNAVDKNTGGNKRFIYGAANKAYPLGTYGVDTSTNPPTAWAVVNHNSDFAVVETGN